MALTGSKKTPSRKQAVSLRHIADELGVSISLVSKVLSGRLGTSGANVKKIRAIHAKARELDYRKNLLAEALRTGRQNVFAVYVHRHGAPGSAIVEDMIGGIADEASKVQQRLLINYYETSDEFRATLPLVHRNSVDGVIMAGIPHGELVDDLRIIHARGVPVVTIHDTQLDKQFPNVGVDQIEVGRLTTTHLIERGCRRIAHFWVHREPPQTSLSDDRYAGYKRALADHGLPYDPALVVQVPDFQYATGVAATNELLQRGVSFDGIYCQSDPHSSAALNTLVTAGKKVPQDVKLIGVDNAPYCDFAIVALSSTSQEFRSRGRLAVDLLTRKLAGESVDSTRTVPVVVARASSS